MRVVLILALAALTACRGPSDSGPPTPVDADGDGSIADDDCNDADAAVFPGAIELCDGVDNNCDVLIDNDASDAQPYYADGDGDGFGAAATALLGCDAPSGFVADGSDCDDGASDVHPGAAEADCTDPIDYNCDGAVGYADGDDDGFAACEDCDDTAASVHPDATERCDGIDNNCDLAIDEGGALGELTWYADADADTFGDPRTTTAACAAPSGYVADNTDCDDTSALALPGGVEVCDGLDNDCDGDHDEPSALDASTWYADADADAYGHNGSPVLGCSAPAGFVADHTDCDDRVTDVHPHATERCDDVDNNCDGAVDEGFDKVWNLDYDGDGHGSAAVTLSACDQPSHGTRSADDCDDLDAAIFPGATEVCNGADDNCDGAIDDADPNLNLSSASTWYADSDGDGFGDVTTTVQTCVLPSGYLADARDCLDTAPDAHPGAPEVWYDGVDQACDGGSDFDQDGDGHDAVAYGGDDANDMNDACALRCPDGLSKAYAGDSCAQILTDFPLSASGLAWVDLDADGDPVNAVRTWCDMETDGGGWTLVGYSTMPNVNMHSLKCGAGNWAPDARGGASASVGAVSLAQRSTDMALAINTGGVTTDTGSLSAYSYAYKMQLPDPGSISFVAHSYHQFFFTTAGACVPTTVTGIVGTTWSGTRYTKANSLGTSWTDSYPTGYGASESSTCVQPYSFGPFITSVHSGAGNYVIGVEVNECDVVKGSLTYNHRQNYLHDGTGHTGSASIWLR